MKMFITTSRRREWEFGTAIGKYTDWIDEHKIISVRFSFGRRALVLTFRKVY